MAFLKETASSFNGDVLEMIVDLGLFFSSMGSSHFLLDPCFQIRSPENCGKIWLAASTCDEVVSFETPSAPKKEEMETMKSPRKVRWNQRKEHFQKTPVVWEFPVTIVPCVEGRDSMTKHDGTQTKKNQRSVDTELTIST